MRVLLDNNVILDAVLQRVPWHKEADAILLEAALGRVSCATTTLSLATIYYVGRQTVGTAGARAAIRSFLSAFEILSIEKQTLLDADSLPGSDFEDNILIAAAMSAGLHAIVTRNPGDFSQSPLPIWSPGELLKQISYSGSGNGGGGGSILGVP